MIKIILFKLLIFLMILNISCVRYENHPFTIEELDFLNRYYTLSDSSKSYSRRFLVKGFKYNNDLQDSLIDVYVCGLMDSLNYEKTVFGFYKESKYTNKESLLDYPKGLYRKSSSDLFCQYFFVKNVFDYKYKKSLNSDKTYNTEVINKLKCKN